MNNVCLSHGRSQHTHKYQCGNTVASQLSLAYQSVCAMGTDEPGRQRSCQSIASLLSRSEDRKDISESSWRHRLNGLGATPEPAWRPPSSDALSHGIQSELCWEEKARTSILQVSKPLSSKTRNGKKSPAFKGRYLPTSKTIAQAIALNGRH